MICVGILRCNLLISDFLSLEGCIYGLIYMVIECCGWVVVFCMLMELMLGRMWGMYVFGGGDFVLIWYVVFF